MLVSGTPIYGPIVGDALKLAADSFATRVRKGSGVPYLTHLLAVANLVMEHGGDEEQIAAAVLHDYLEDIPSASKTDLEARFGVRVAHLVEALSDSLTAENKMDWRPRKESYLAHLKTAKPEVKLISSADKLHNAHSIVVDFDRFGEAIFDRFSVPRDQTLWYYREVVGALAHQWDHALLGRLRGTVGELHRRVGLRFP